MLSSSVEICCRLALLAWIRRLGRKPPPADLLQLEERRSRLQDRIDRFSSSASSAWPLKDNDDPSDAMADNAEADDLLSDDSEDDLQEEHEPRITHGRWQPELVSIMLPSAVGHELCRAAGFDGIVEKEKVIRMGQANDALQGLRVALSRKAILFRGLRDATSKTKRNKSWDQIKATTGSARHHVRLYLRARHALIMLGATEEEMSIYRPLTREQLKITAARIDLNLRGSRNTALPWFWAVDLRGDSEMVDGMEECESHPCR